MLKRSSWGGGSRIMVASFHSPANFGFKFISRDETRDVHVCFYLIPMSVHFLIFIIKSSEI